MKVFIFVLTFFPIINLPAQINIVENEIDRAVIHKRIINVQDTLDINILRINLSIGNYSLQSVKAGNKLNAKQTTSDMVKNLGVSGYEIIAAINADFFESDGEIINNMISKRTIVKAVKFTDSPHNNFVNSQFAVTINNKLLMDQFVFTGNIVLPDGRAEEIKRINSRADSNSITIYNNNQGNYTPATPDHWFKIQFGLKPVELTKDTLLFIVESISKNKEAEILDGGIVLSSNNGYAYYLQRELAVSDTVGILLRFNPYHSDLQMLVGGWPRIVSDGKNLIRTNPEVEGVFPRFSETRHPRSGIGFSNDSSLVYFITVDGRQESSRGMSLEEFADLMISEGIYQGLNLDGGGSTTMVINGNVVNNPSDSSGERKVGNCIVLIKKNE